MQELMHLARSIAIGEGSCGAIRQGIGGRPVRLGFPYRLAGRLHGFAPNNKANDWLILTLGRMLGTNPGWSLVAAPQYARRPAHGPALPATVRRLSRGQAISQDHSDSLKQLGKYSVISLFPCRPPQERPMDAISRNVDALWGFPGAGTLFYGRAEAVRR
jgi:hypothetical protein